VFKKLHPGLPIFDLVFHTNLQEMEQDKIDNTVLKGKDGQYLSYDDLPSHAKAEALFPIIVASCLNLSSSYKHVLQDIFGHLVFHARTSVCGFVVTCRGSASDLSNEAASYLHGRFLKNLMGVPEETFIWFVIITDFLHYHYHTLGHLSKKYRHLLSRKNEDYNGIVHLHMTYEGVKDLMKPEKGFCDSDIRFFQVMKSTVIAERHSTTVASMEDMHGMEGSNESAENTFIFHYPGSSRHLKKENDALTNGKKRKRKETGDLLGAGEMNRAENLAMTLYEEDSSDTICNETFPV
jgi:hypothetical protein